MGFSRMSQQEKGDFRVDISDEAVAEALRAVEAVSAPAQNEAEVVVEVEREAEVAVEVEAASASELEALREELRQRDLLLEESARRTQELMGRLREANDMRLRAAADLDNYKKRAAREREEIQKFGVEKLLGELIPVLDNFDRALAHAGGGTDLESFSQGVAMTRRVFEETLGKFGVKGFSAVGEAFDPRLHEAIQQVESSEHPAGVVAQELVRGYLLHERLVRPALVAVSSGPGPVSSGDEQA